MRQYEAIWLRLKKDSSVRIAAPAALHRRIVKAVTKEKDMDVVYKMEMIGKNIRVYLKHESEGGVLRFWLDKKFTLLHQVSVTDL